MKTNGTFRDNNYTNVLYKPKIDHPVRIRTIITKLQQHPVR